MVDIIGPACDNAVTARPARTNVLGAVNTWFKDCTEGLENGTEVPADWLNAMLAQMRVAFVEAGIVLDNADDMLWRAIQSVGLRYVVASGTANSMVANPAVPVPAYYAGLPLLVRAPNGPTGGACEINVSGLGNVFIRRMDGTELESTDWPDDGVGLLVMTLLDLGGPAVLGFQLITVMPAPGVPGVPTYNPGDIVMTADDAAPAGTLIADGSAVSRATYGNLFTKLGVMYGAGNGTTTFNLPDYRGYFLRGQDRGRNLDPNAATRTNRGDGQGGDFVGTKQTDELKLHDHPGSTVTIPGKVLLDQGVWPDWNTSGERVVSGPNGLTTEWALPVTLATALPLNMGNSGGLETRPKNINVLICIAF